jgi:hypothetical protein
MSIVNFAFPDPEDNFFGEPIYSYSRAQAIADGALVDVSETAQQVGFRYPVALTAALYERLLPSPHEIGGEVACPEERRDDRLWKLLWLVVLHIRFMERNTDTIQFQVTLQEADPKTGEYRKVDLRLWAVCGPGDQGEPVVTVGFPEDF